MKYISFLLLTLLFTISACNSDDELNDRARGIFIIGGERYELRCKVDGEDRFPTSTESNPYLGGLPFKVTYKGAAGGGLSFSADIKDDNGVLLSTVAPTTQNAIINEELIGRIGSTYYRNWEISGICKDFNLITLDDLTIIISELNESQKRIKVNFSYTAFNECGDSVQITDGYLDAPYQD